jgi:hypothetical protein
MPAHEVVEQAMLELRLREIEALDLDALSRIEEAVHRGRQEAHEVTVPEQQTSLVLPHDELADVEHGRSPHQIPTTGAAGSTPLSVKDAGVALGG